MIIRTMNKKVGIVGIGWSGKTVFMTSLISHLKNHNPKRFKLRSKSGDSNARILKFKELKEGMDLPIFEWEKHYNTLLHEKFWPKKTTDACCYRCQFERSDWSWCDIDLTLLDFPGERFNDAVMFTGEGTFADWSAAVLKKIESDPPVLALAEKYYQALSSHLTLGGINPTEIIVAYKRTLAQFMMNYGAFITPSIFALDRRGQAPEDLRDAAKIAESRLIGLDEDHEFAPLPEDFREQHPEIYKIFEANFQHYKETLIEPLYRQLGQCDTLLILIDIPGLLASNVGRFNDTAAIISYVLEATTKHSNNWWKRLIRLSKTKNIGFIATKADLINYADKSQTNALVNLMDELLMPAINQYPIENKLFTCAAIKSTHEHEEETIQGYPVYTATGEITPEPDPDMDMSLLYPSKLPTEWPGSWTYGKYFFPEVWPILHERRNAALDHNNLDVITEYILGNDRV